MQFTFLNSPVGRLLIAGDEKALQLVSFPGGSTARQPEPDWIPQRRPFSRVIQQLEQYFAGTRVEFDLSLAPQGTPFQKSVWAELQKIPYGKTISYGELAQRIGNPNASRAVGAANGANPIPIIIPCHRVIGADNSLTGFGGGIETKKQLLAIEGHEPAQDRQLGLFA